MSSDQTGRVRRRRVFYLPGYDPFHPRRYRELYRKEGAAQAALLGYDLALSPKTGAGRYGWHVSARIEGAETETDIEVLVWHDIVKASMDQSLAGTYAQLARTAWIYISTGALFRLMRLRKGPVIAALYPVGALLLQLALAIAAGWGLALGIGWALPGVLGLALGALAGTVLAWAVLDAFRRHDNRLFAYYLMHDYAYSARHGGANPPALEGRMAEFGEVIAAALAEEVDEVLVVGHSSGAHLAVSILADLYRAGRVPEDGPVLSFLSLGQVIPMVSFLPDAWRLRADLRFLGKLDRLTWVDVTAPGDGCAFALCDPVAVSGVAKGAREGPLVLSAAFTQTLAPATWKALRRRYFRLHFQYLCAFDALKGAVGEYDYFRVTAGPMTLRDRFASRDPSRSRIESPVNRFTSVAP